MSSDYTRNTPKPRFEKGLDQLLSDKPGCKNGANVYVLPLYLSPKAKLDRVDYRIIYVNIW
jgi:hypothetical protein